MRLSWALSLGQLITWGTVYYTFSLILGPVQAELGLSRAEASLAFALALLAEGLMAFAVGRWIDAGHERRVMTLGSLAAALGLLAHSQIDSLWSFYAVWIWLGMASAATVYTPAFAVVTRRFPLDYRRAIITITLFGGLASTVFIPLSSWWIALWGWREALWAMAALHLFVNAPLHALCLRDAPRAAVLSGLVPALPRWWGPHWRDPVFVAIAVFVVLTMAVTAALPAHMILLLHEAGLSPAMVVAIPAAIGAAQVLARGLLWVFERRWDVHTTNRWIPTLVPAGLIAVIWAGWSPWGAGLFVVLFGMGNGLNTIVKGTVVAQYIGREHVGTLNGVLGLPIALARAAAPLLMGVLWSPSAGYRTGLWLMCAASFIGLLTLWWAQHQALKPHTRPPQGR
jgi:MFS family permease